MNRIEFPFATTRGTVREIRLDLTKIKNRDYAWAVAHIKQVEMLVGGTKPQIYFPDSIGIQADVLFVNDERIVMMSGSVCLELLNTQRSAA